jgi:hypothetical protein
MHGDQERDVRASERTSQTNVLMLIPLALSILQKKSVPSAVFVKHQLLTPANGGLIYPVETD